MASSPGSLSRLLNKDVTFRVGYLRGQSGLGSALTVNIVGVIMRGLNRLEWRRDSASSTTVKLEALVYAELACASVQQQRKYASYPEYASRNHSADLV